MEEDTIEHRAKCFCYYFLHTFEEKILKYLSILEEDSNVPNSTLGNAISGILGAVPKIGNGLKIAASQVDKWIVTKLQKTDSIKLARLVYCYRDNKNTTREMLLECGLKIFMAFEEQMSKISASGGAHRAMQKMAMDSINRYFMYHLDNPDIEVSVDNIAKGILLGTSISYNFGITKPGKTLIVNKQEWKTSKVISEVGLCTKENASFEYYRRNHTSPKKYGYRLLFSNENVDEIKRVWKKDIDVEDPYQYQLNVQEYAVIFTTCWEYYLHQHSQMEFRYNMENALTEIWKDKEIQLSKIIDDNKNNHTESFEHRNQLNVNTIKAIETLKNEIVEIATACLDQKAEATLGNDMNQQNSDSITTIAKEECLQLILKSLDISNKKYEQINILQHNIKVMLKKEFSEANASAVELKENERLRYKNFIQEMFKTVFDQKIEELRANDKTIDIKKTPSNSSLKYLQHNEAIDINDNKLDIKVKELNSVCTAKTCRPLFDEAVHTDKNSFEIQDELNYVNCNEESYVSLLDDKVHTNNNSLDVNVSQTSSEKNNKEHSLKDSTTTVDDIEVSSSCFSFRFTGKT